MHRCTGDQVKEISSEFQAFPTIIDQIPVGVVGEGLVPGFGSRGVGIAQRGHSVAVMGERQE